MEYTYAGVMKWTPETMEQFCARLRSLDATYGTVTDSPLHHDNRCPIHKGNK